MQAEDEEDNLEGPTITRSIKIAQILSSLFKSYLLSRVKPFKIPNLMLI